MAGAVGQRAVVLDQPLQRFPGQVEAVEIGVAALQRRDDMKRLRVVVEAAEIGEALVERALAGVTERRMAEIVAKRRRLRQILVEAERTRQRAGDLGHFQRVRQPGAEVVALVEDENLGLVAEPAKRRGVDDAVAVAAEHAAARALGLREAPAAARRRLRGERRAGEGCYGHGLSSIARRIGALLTLAAAALNYQAAKGASE